jgi:hypothetical protein
MTRDSTPASLLLIFVAVLFVVGARIAPPPTTVAAADRSQATYQLADELTLTGTVTGMPRVPHATSPIVVTLRTARQPFDLVLAPASFLTDVELTFRKGDDIRVTGAKGLLHDDEVVFVREVTHGTRTVALRDPCGAPLWPMTVDGEPPR